LFLYICNSNRGVEQLVARRAHNPKAAGSSPASATRKTGLVNMLVRFFYFYDLKLAP
ncbi:MAG: hypothetical protein RJA52_1198, partial [Bacteroidota bacterium]